MTHFSPKVTVISTSVSKSNEKCPECLQDVKHPSYRISNSILLNFQIGYVQFHNSTPIDFALLVSFGGHVIKGYDAPYGRVTNTLASPQKTGDDGKLLGSWYCCQKKLMFQGAKMFKTSTCSVGGHVGNRCKIGPWNKWRMIWFHWFFSLEKMLFEKCLQSKRGIQPWLLAGKLTSHI